MTQHALSRHGMAAAGRVRSRRRRGVVQFVMDRFLLLPLGAVIALVWANVASESYYRFAHAIAFPVNEIGMALFLALVAQEIYEAMMPGGGLSSWRRWSMPLVAAAGGFAGAALGFVGYVSLRHEQVLAQAWPPACAIDIGAGYYVLKMIYRRSAAVPFLLLLAIATDGVALAMLAARTPVDGNHVLGGLLVLTAMGIAAILRRHDVRGFFMYLAVAGTVSWTGFYVAGVHPALALVPIVPFLAHEPRGVELFAGPPDDDRVHRGEHEWNEIVQVVLFLFGLVNAGVILRGYDTGTWAVLVAALVGRPLGIVVAVGLAVAAGLHLPRGIGWREVVVVALATSSGFTLALFFATGVAPVGAVLQQIKLGALASAMGALVTLGVAWAWRLGRFARPRGSGVVWGTVSSRAVR